MSSRNPEIPSAVSDLISRIETEYSVFANPRTLKAEDFWQFAAVHCTPDDFPEHLGRNMLIVLYWIEDDHSPSHELYIRLSQFLTSFDVCQDPVISDLAIDRELKIDYIRNEMRSARKQYFCESNRIFSALNPAQKHCIYRWLKTIRKTPWLQYVLDDQLLQCWRAYTKGSVPTLDEI